MITNLVVLWAFCHSNTLSDCKKGKWPKPLNLKVNQVEHFYAEIKERNYHIPICVSVEFHFNRCVQNYKRPQTPWSKRVKKAVRNTKWIINSITLEWDIQAINKMTVHLLFSHKSQRRWTQNMASNRKGKKSSNFNYAKEVDPTSWKYM